jgi:hypothetical protein
MSTRRSTEEIVARLAAGLAPVRPVASLPRQALAVSAVWAASAAIAVAWLGVHPLDTIARGAISAALLGALALIGAAGLALGLAARRPGSERLASAGAIGAGLGVLAVALALPGPITDADTLAHSTDCFARSLLLAIPCGVLAVGFCRRGAPWRPRAAGIGVALGAVALGALLVHAGCPSPSPAHRLTAHALLPLATGASAGLLVAWRFAQHARGARRAIARTLAA